MLRPECCLGGCHLLLFPGHHQRPHTQDLCPPPVINDRHMANQVKAAQKYYYTCYLCNRGDFIKVRSVIMVQVFFHRLFAEGAAANAAIGFQETAPIPAEEGAEEDEEQYWDWIYVDPFVRSFICGNIFQYRQLSTLANFTLRLSNTCLLN